MLKLSSLLKQSTNQIHTAQICERLEKYCDSNQFSSAKTKQVINWSLRLIRFHNQQHPADLSQGDIETFITWLAAEESHSKETQHQAAKSIQILYYGLLNIDLNPLNYQSVRIRRSLETRFGFTQCRAILDNMRGESLLMAELAFYAKLRLKEVVQLKLTDINLKKNRITIKHKTGITEKITIPLKLNLSLRIQAMRVKQQILKSALAKQFLFPYRHSNNNLVELNTDQLQLLKNDIQIAIKQFKRLSPLNTAHSYIQNRKLSNSHKYINDYARLKNNYKKANQTSDQQTAFNFKTKPSVFTFDSNVA
jgi:integrase